MEVQQELVVLGELDGRCLLSREGGLGGLGLAGGRRAGSASAAGSSAGRTEAHRQAGPQGAQAPAAGAHSRGSRVRPAEHVPPVLLVNATTVVTRPPLAGQQTLEFANFGSTNVLMQQSSKRKLKSTEEACKPEGDLYMSVNFNLDVFVL